MADFWQDPVDLLLYFSWPASPLLYGWGPIDWPYFWKKHKHPQLSVLSTVGLLFNTTSFKLLMVTWVCSATVFWRKHLHIRNQISNVSLTSFSTPSNISFNCFVFLSVFAIVLIVHSQYFHSVEELQHLSELILLSGISETSVQFCPF